jgi:hypothetical protein
VNKRSTAKPLITTPDATLPSSCLFCRRPADKSGQAAAARVALKLVASYDSCVCERDAAGRSDARPCEVDKVCCFTWLSRWPFTWLSFDTDAVAVSKRWLYSCAKSPRLQRLGSVCSASTQSVLGDMVLSDLPTKSMFECFWLHT